MKLPTGFLSSLPTLKNRLGIDSAVWRIYMAMLHGKSLATDGARQEGRFLKVKFNDTIILYLIDSTNGKFIKLS